MKLLKIILIPIIIGLFVFIGFFVIQLFNGNKEVVELKNEKNGETIFLIKQSWGNDSRIAIGLNKKLKTGFKNTPTDKYYENISTEFIFYKFENDRLVIYGNSFQEPEIIEFQTKIDFIELSNIQFIRLGENKNYEKDSLLVFPPSTKRRLNYVDSINNND